MIRNRFFSSKHKLVIFFFIVLAPYLLSAQNDKPQIQDKSFKEIKGLAKNALRLGDTYTALFYYEEWAYRAPDNPKVVYQTAELFRITRNYAKAEEWYRKLIPANSEKFPLSLFHLANVQMSLEKYDTAKTNFLAFKKLSRDIKDPSYRKLLKSGIESCDYAMGAKDAPKMAVADHLDGSVNKPHIEFSPIEVDEKTLIYGSLRESGVNYYDVALHDSMKIPVRKLYVAIKEGDEWKSKGELTGPFNQEGRHVGNAVLSEDGKRMYYTLCQKNWQGKVICHLYYSNKNGSQWEEPIELDELTNLSNYTTTQPAIGRESKKNQEIVYFASDRPGGKGGLDIWYIQYNKKRKVFKAPKNAGSKINTVGTESTPYYDLSTHRLYFSSDGGVGFGGLDIFSVNGEKSKWDEPKNLGKEINSSADDLDFTLKKNKKGGFLVSNRAGGAALLSPTCCDDIYEFTYEKFIEINFSGRVQDSAECLTDYILNVYIEDKESGEKYLSRQIEVDSCDFKLSLDQGIDYKVEVVKEGYFNAVKEISTASMSRSTELEEEIQITKIPTQPILLANILYEFNSAELTAEAKMAIDTTLYKMMVENPRIIIQISSHTDSKGTASYNLSLSEKRAKSVLRYMIQKGIKAERIKSKGYGESKPVAPNTKEDGSDNPEGRKLNRRTEMEVLGKIELEDTE